MAFNLAYVRGLTWMSDPKDKAIVNQLSDKGLHLDIYRDPYQRHWDPLVVYDKKAFEAASGITLIRNAESINIEYTSALLYTKWHGLKIYVDDEMIHTENPIETALNQIAPETNPYSIPEFTMINGTLFNHDVILKNWINGQRESDNYYHFTFEVVGDTFEFMLHGDHRTEPSATLNQPAFEQLTLF